MTAYTVSALAVAGVAGPFTALVLVAFLNRRDRRS